MHTLIIHYSEIGLKGKNRSYFENRLIDHIRAQSKKRGLTVHKVRLQDKRIVAEIEGDQNIITDCLQKIFGIQYFMYVESVAKNLDTLLVYMRQILENVKNQGQSSVAFMTKRKDKNFPLNTIQLNTLFGQIAFELSIKVDYKNAPQTIYIEVANDNNIFIAHQKISCHGGLPVGTAGKFLTLLSGGIDSPVAAWKMMRRGCRTDFIHIHSFRSNQLCLESKIKKIVEKLNEYQQGSRLYLLPYSSYEALVFNKVPARHDMILFKHVLFRLADRLAMKKRYKAIISGDSLGQVASQTVENIACTELYNILPIFRPLISYEKNEIVNLAHTIGTFDLSAEDYKDCCSIQARNPLTKTRVPHFKELLNEIEADFIVTKLLAELEFFEI